MVERHCQDGVDFLTIHAGLNRGAAEKIKHRERITNIVSRGGAFMFTWMQLNDREKSFYVLGPIVTDVAPGYDPNLPFMHGHLKLNAIAENRRRGLNECRHVLEEDSA